MSTSRKNKMVMTNDEDPTISPLVERLVAIFLFLPTFREEKAESPLVGMVTKHKVVVP
jgi:hypothetical protein